MKMYKFLYITLFITLLHAQTPKPFASLGDEIYNNLDKIILLRDMNIYKIYVEDIDTYIKKVKKTKKMGYRIERGTLKKSTGKYLRNLRALSKKNKYFVESIENYYTMAKQENNFKLFSQIVNSGLIDVKKHKKDIYSYYAKHKNRITLDATLEKIVKKESKKRVKKAKLKKYKSKHSRAQEKIMRMRASDARARDALEKKLQNELDKKKREILEEQEKELCI